MNEPFTLDPMPTFCVTVPDDSLLDIGLHTGDVLFCDGETAPTRYVISTYADDPDGIFHVCTLIGGKHLWDEAGGKDAPASATVWGAGAVCAAIIDTSEAWRMCGGRGMILGLFGFGSSPPGSKNRVQF